MEVSSEVRIGLVQMPKDGGFRIAMNRFEDNFPQFFVQLNRDIELRMRQGIEQYHYARSIFGGQAVGSKWGNGQ